MNIEETKNEQQIRLDSERFNPYHIGCKNKHLWSEGFRRGYQYANNWYRFDENKPEFDKLVLVKSYTGIIEIATYERSEKGINLFDKEKKLSDFTVAFWRDIY